MRSGFEGWTVDFHPGCNTICSAPSSDIPAGIVVPSVDVNVAIST